MRDRNVSSLALVIVSTIAALALGACGAGTSGGDGPGGGGPTGFFLKTSEFGRPIFDVNGELVDVINPASLFEVDPLTNVTVEGFPKPLTPNVDLGELVSFNFEQILDPITPQVPVVPRNAVIILGFSQALNENTLKTSDADPDNPGLLTAASPVKVVRKDGSMVPTVALVEGKQLILSPITTDAAGWPASPLVFDSQGEVVEDPTGTLRVVTNDSITPLQSTSNLVLTPREDNLGTTVKPLPFNPGNSQLDAIKLQTDNSLIGFNGFLPDLTAPRIIRGLEVSGEITAISTGLVEGQAVAQIHDATLTDVPNTTANDGRGEWANGLLEVTSAGGDVSLYAVAMNFSNPASPFEPIFELQPGVELVGVAVGDTYTVRRTEFYEPIAPPLPDTPLALAQVTVDPDARPRDPNDPADAVNHDLRYFVQVLDEAGEVRTDVWDPTIGLFAPIPPKSSIALRFSEAMDLSTFHSYESFYITTATNAKTDPSFQDMRVGVTKSALEETQVIFEPFLENQLDPSQSSYIGFGGAASNLKLVIRTKPTGAELDAILQSASPANLEKIVDLDEAGVLGVTDLGGRGLGLPAAMLNQGDTDNFLLSDGSVGRSAFGTAVDFEVSFQTAPTADPSYGAVVHRFMGQATSSAFTPPPGPADTNTQGIEYFDFPPEVDGDGVVTRRYIYGPRVFDTGLNSPGRLIGAAGVAIEHLVDDFNKPAPSAFAGPNGEDFLIALGFGSSTPIVSDYGARFQHVYRAGDASPSYFDFRGVVLDLVGLAWSPLGLPGTGQIDDFELLVSNGQNNRGRGPNTNQSSGIPTAKNSGLSRQFDFSLLEWAENTCEFDDFSNALKDAYNRGQPPQASMVKTGTPYGVTQASLISPANAVGGAGSFNAYLPYPQFNGGIDPYFGKTDVFSYPYDSEFPMVLEYRIRQQVGATPPPNVFRFSPGILSSALPRFRIWSLGQNPLAHGIPNYGLGAQQNNSWRSGEGGPLVEPASAVPPGGIAGLPHPSSGNTSPSGGLYTGPFPGPFPAWPIGLWGNGQPPIPSDPNNPYEPLPVPDWRYILPPAFTCVPSTSSAQPEGDFTNGNFNQNIRPLPNTNPDMNFYFANGMFDTPLPNMPCYPGPPGMPPTTQYGYGRFPIGAVPTPCTLDYAPAYQLRPNEYGDNQRYYMLWQYTKRVSIIESPAWQVQPEGSTVRYLQPIIEPPLSEVDPAAGVNVDLRAGTQIDFSIASLESGYVSATDPDLASTLSGVEENYVYVKFRATLGIAPGQTQGPSLDLVVIPYEKID